MNIMQTVTLALQQRNTWERFQFLVFMSVSATASDLLVHAVRKTSHPDLHFPQRQTWREKEKEGCWKSDGKSSWNLVQQDLRIRWLDSAADSSTSCRFTAHLKHTRILTPRHAVLAHWAVTAYRGLFNLLRQMATARSLNYPPPLFSPKKQKTVG